MAGIEKRECGRFEILGATLVYHSKRGIFSKPKYSDDEFPIYDLSYGGLRFLSQEKLKMKSSIVIKIMIPEQEEAIEFAGKIARIAHHPGQSYNFQIGVQFFPYGHKKGLNPPEKLILLKALEEKHSPPGEEKV
jgi:hypothetical protein